jgi:hypothetical protein
MPKGKFVQAHRFPRRSVRRFPFSCADPTAYCISVSSRAGLAGIISLMIFGCVSKSSVSEAQWRLQLERQQQRAREAGRIGYIGNEGPPAN